MDYVWTFLRPFLKDKAVWLALSAWLLKLANSKLHLGMNDDWITTTAGLTSTWAVTHVTHLKFLGGDGKMPDETPPEEKK